MVKEEIFIFGGGLQAKLVIDIIEKEGSYSISGILDSFKRPGIKVAGYEILVLFAAQKPLMKMADQPR